MTHPDTKDSAGAHASLLASRPGNGTGRPTGEGSDRRIEKRWWTRGRTILIAATVVVAALVIWGLSAATGDRRLHMDPEKLTIAEVVHAPFQENVAVMGNVLPQTTVYLDIQEGGRVEEIFVLEGQQVEQGQPILRLMNNDLQLRLLSADAARLEQVNRLQDIRFRMEQNTLDLRQQLAQMNYNILRLEREHARNSELLDRSAISQRQFDDTRDELDYWRNTKDLTLQGYQQDSVRIETQLRQMEVAVQRMEANYEVLQRILDNLVVRAPISGQLTAFEPQIGQIVGAGSNIGQIDVLDGYKVRAGVDEFYIARVQRGQHGSAEITGVEYELRVTRVYPEVRDGRFEVDLEFAGEQPAGIRRGQTIRFLLALSEPAEALLLPRGGFFQSTGGNWVFVVQGNQAVKRNIRLGRQNTGHYEVLDGLVEGERVVVSGYEGFGDAGRLLF